jgi:hypothetical protein
VWREDADGGRKQDRGEMGGAGVLCSAQVREIAVENRSLMWFMILHGLFVSLTMYICLQTTRRQMLEEALHDPQVYRHTRMVDIECNLSVIYKIIPPMILAKILAPSCFIGGIAGIGTAVPETRISGAAWRKRVVR